MDIHHSQDGFLIACSRDELIIMGNALNNIPQAVQDVDYTTLIGATKGDVTVLLERIVAALSRQ